MDHEHPPILNYGPKPTRHYRLYVAVTLTLFLFGLWLLSTTLETRRSYAVYYYQTCQSNLHQIGLGILMYCGDHNGNYPDSFSTLLLNESLAARVFVCGSTNDAASTAPTTQEQADDLNVPGHSSYIYLGKGLTDKTVIANQVVAYEPLSNHGDRMSVLCGDGHAEILDLRRGQVFMKMVATTRPAMLPP